MNRNNSMQCDNNFDRLIRNVIDAGLCCGCGTCVGACHTDAIDFMDNKYYPEWFKKGKCDKCGFCTDVCPGKGLPLNGFTQELKTPQQQYAADVGNYKEFFIGYSQDELVRIKAASGGIATSLLICALEKNIVDKIVVVVNDEREVAKPIVKIVDSKKGVLGAMQSKYVQAPVNRVIKEILKSEYRYGIIGLPCHLEGLYLAQKKYKKLSDQIVFKLGLFCGYSYSYNAVDALLNRMDLRRETIDRFLGWREGDCYPGFFSVKLRDGQIKRISFAKEHNIDVANFALLRCFLCIDALAQLADISLGDTPDDIGNNSFIISRTDIGAKLLELAEKERYIKYYSANKTAFKKGIIPFMLLEKRHKALAVIQHLSKRNIPVPKWDIKEAKISGMDKINGILRFNMSMFIRTSVISKFLKSNPRIMEIVGGVIYHLDVNPRHMIFKMLRKISMNVFKKFGKR